MAKPNNIQFNPFPIKDVEALKLLTEIIDYSDARDPRIYMEFVGSFKALQTVGLMPEDLVPTTKCGIQSFDLYDKRRYVGSCRVSKRANNRYKMDFMDDLAYLNNTYALQERPYFTAHQLKCDQIMIGRLKRYVNILERHINAATLYAPKQESPRVEPRHYGNLAVIDGGRTD